MTHADVSQPIPARSDSRQRYATPTFMLPARNFSPATYGRRDDYLDATVGDVITNGSRPLFEVDEISLSIKRVSTIDVIEVYFSRIFKCSLMKGALIPTPVSLLAMRAIKAHDWRT